MSEQKIYFDADMNNLRAVAALGELTRLYGNVSSAEKADVIVCLGGDGKMLKSMQLGATLNKPIFGMNLGHVGALLNAYSAEKLIERIEKAVTYSAFSLAATGKTVAGEDFLLHAFNEISFKNIESSQVADLQIDCALKSERVRGDGFLISTPQGSGAYNLSAGGYKLSFNERLLTTTSLNSMPPLRFMLNDYRNINVSVNDPLKRPVMINADHMRLDNILSCKVAQDKGCAASLLFDPSKMDTLNEQSLSIRRRRLQQARLERALGRL